jgi:hypothetical protein
MSLSRIFDIIGTRNLYATSSIQDITFPSDISDAHIRMKFVKYQRRSINQQPFTVPDGGVRLPIPSSLKDNTSVEYSTDSLGPVAGAAVEGLSRVGEITNLSQFNNIGGQIVAAIGQGIVAQGITAAAGQIPGFANVSASQALSGVSALTGVSINPFQTVTFKTPQFKKHAFSWKLVPNNKDESEKIENILRLLKYHTLPSVGPTAVGASFFGYPEMVLIELKPDNRYLYKFKPCVIESVSVNYAPLGPSFYRGSRAPTAVELSVNLQEIEIWTKADYIRDGRGIPVGSDAFASTLSANLRI